MIYLGNAFSLGMLDMENINLKVDRCSPSDVPEEAISIVGHADTALLVSAILGREVPMNRASTSLEIGDVLYVAQYNGPRLPEGATSLPEGAKIRWYRVALLLDQAKAFELCCSKEILDEASNICRAIAWSRFNKENIVKKFPTPSFSFSETENIKPIHNELDLELEGALMTSAAGWWKSRCYSGESIIFRVVGNCRATFELNSKGELIHLRGVRNVVADAETENLVNEFMKQVVPMGE